MSEPDRPAGAPIDAVIYRAGLVPTVFAARQIVNHKHVLVNGKSVNIPSYMIKEGDVIELTAKGKTIPCVLQAQKNPESEVPDYINVDAKAFKATFIRTPILDDVPYPVQMEPNLSGRILLTLILVMVSDPTKLRGPVGVTLAGFFSGDQAEVNCGLILWCVNSLA